MNQIQDDTGSSELLNSVVSMQTFQENVLTDLDHNMGRYSFKTNSIRDSRNRLNVIKKNVEQDFRKDSDKYGSVLSSGEATGLKYQDSVSEDAHREAPERVPSRVVEMMAEEP
jgi:ABC-type molybdenum transport system ATPase subunit/photorepair protein PhrA